METRSCVRLKEYLHQSHQRLPVKLRLLPSQEFGASILSGAHMTVFPRVLQLMKEKELDDVLLTGGGIIPDADMKKLEAIGCGKLFSPGTETKLIVTYITEFVKANRKF